MKKTFRLAILAGLFSATAAGFPDSGGDLSEAAREPEPRSAAPSTAREAASNFQRLLSELEREEQATRKRLAQVSKEADQVRERTIANGRAYVRWARAGLMPIGNGFSALVAHAARLERMHRAIERDQARERALHNERIQLSKKLQDLAVRRAPLEAQGRALAQNEALLLSEQDRETAFRRAFLSSGPTGHTAVYGAGVGPADATEQTGFAALKGRLPFPIAGRSEIRSARRAGAEGPGLELMAQAGSPVRAVCGGRVAFADAYADYGKTVIIDHGDKHYTVSANLGRIDVRVGDEVSAAAPIGSVGPSASGPMLYFEIRAGNQVVDPAEWFGI